MKTLLAALLFYGRFALPFSRIGHRRRVGAGVRERFDFRGQRWLVTGASGGLGAAIASRAARNGAEVVAMARDARRLEALAHAVDGPGRIIPTMVDLSLLAAVDQAGRAAAASGGFDVVVHNVGVMVHDFERTPEGVERGLATNLLGHHVLDRALRESGAISASTALIAMSSGGAYGARLDLAALEADDPRAHDGFAAYAQHKRAQVALVEAWNAEGPGPAYAMHPGWVDTPGVATALPGFRRFFGPVLRSAEEGADTALWLAATRPPPRPDTIWLDRHADPAHAFGFTRSGASPAELRASLEARAAAAGIAGGTAAHGTSTV